MAYKMDPNLMLALAETEGSKGNVRFRFGLYGRYWLPFGIDKNCKVKRPWTPGGNAEAGIKAIARHLHKCDGDLKAALHLYNTGDRGKAFDNYYAKIIRLKRQNEREKVFD